MIRVTGRKPAEDRDSTGRALNMCAEVDFERLARGSVFACHKIYNAKFTVQKVTIERYFDSWTRRINRPVLRGIQIVKRKDRRRNTEKAVAFYYPATRRPFAIYLPSKDATITTAAYPEGRFWMDLQNSPEYQSAKSTAPAATEESTPAAAMRHIMRGAELKALPAGTERQRVTYGADPEFEYLAQSGEQFQAANAKLIPDFFRPRNWMTAPIGIDGEGNQVELRPAAADTPEALADNIAELLKSCPYPLGFIGNRYALGCHIHIGIGQPYYPPSDLLNLFHHFLGRPAKVLNGLARRDYARLDYRPIREQPHGFEYRSAPAAIMQTPRFFALCARIVGRLTEAYTSGDVIEVNDAPEFEDYFNFCGFSLDDYKYFIENLKRITSDTPNTDAAAAWLSAEELEERAARSAGATAEMQAERERRHAEARELRQREIEEQRAREAQIAIRDALATIERTELCDDWNERAAAIVAEVFEGLGAELETQDRRVLLFGIASNRGAYTYNYTAPSFPELPRETYEGRSRLHFGLPRGLRTTRDEQTANILREHLTIIRETISATIQRGDI